MENTGQIVILEDDPEDRELIKEVLLEIGVTEKMVFFEDAHKALDYLIATEEQPFLILSDINLPGMSGLQFQQKISENEYLRKKSIPLVFLTTVDNAGIIEQVYSLTVQGFFIKPSTFAEFKDTLASITSYWRLCRHPNILQIP
jgi:CheY-like chemotaxis protein